jgi:aryl-alcohol dehydrogenase-like predicted oxidoreductase
MRQAIVTRNHMPNRMTYARLGKTGFLMSRVSVGGYVNHGMKANAGTMAGADPDAYRAALQYLLDNGVNFFDTAPDPSYGSEGYIGELLAAPGNRGRAFVCTKVDKLVKDLETGEPFTEKEMRESFRSGLITSLEALRLDRIDVLLLHHLTTFSDNPYHNLGYVGPNYDHLKMAYDVIDGLITEGLVTHKGFNSHWPDTARDALTLPGLAGRTDVATIKYMVTRKWFQGQEPVIWEREVLPVLTEQDVGVVQMKILMGPHQTLQQKMEILEGDPPAYARVKPFLDDGDTLPQALIRWSLAQEAAHTRIIGITRVSIAEEDLVPARPGATRNPSTVTADLPQE